MGMAIALLVSNERHSSVAEANERKGGRGAQMEKHYQPQKSTFCRRRGHTQRHRINSSITELKLCLCLFVSICHGTTHVRECVVVI